MHVVVVGGTGFIGRAIVQLLAADHRVTVIHRGHHEVDGAAGGVAHLHIDRQDLVARWPELDDGGLDVLVDVAAYTRSDARAVLDAVPSHSDIRFVVLSSMDVYAVWASFRSAGIGSEQVLDETAPVREERYIYRDGSSADKDYEKLDVEDEYGSRGATVLRLPMVYGEHDDQRREDFILRRCRARREQIPMGPGTLRWSKGYVADIAEAARLVVADESSTGHLFNVCEAETWSMREWAGRIMEASSCDAGVVEVPDERLPSDMRLTGAFAVTFCSTPAS